MLHTKIIDTKDSKLSIQKAQNFISSQDYGASIFFTGTVRNQNNDQIVTGITYDSHDEMVLKSFKEIYKEANEKLGFPADLREYNICLDILQHFKISSVNLLTNNPKKVSALEEVGISVTKRTSLHEGENEKNKNYLDTKRDKMGHLR